MSQKANGFRLREESTISKKILISKNPHETQGIGKRLAASLVKGDIIALVGDLGSGKTTFVKGIAEGLGIVSGHVNSPSFAICQEYEGALPLYHFDFHRMTGETDLQRLEVEIGLGDYLEGEGICAIEWADRAMDLLPSDYLQIDFSLAEDDSRQLSFRPKGKHYEEKVGLL